VPSGVWITSALSEVFKSGSARYCLSQVTAPIGRYRIPVQKLADQDFDFASSRIIEPADELRGIEITPACLLCPGGWQSVDFSDGFLQGNRKPGKPFLFSFNVGRKRVMFFGYGGLSGAPCDLKLMRSTTSQCRCHGRCNGHKNRQLSTNILYPFGYTSLSAWLIIRI
jgi:hypothetical protein